MRSKALAIIIFCFLITSSFALLYFDGTSEASGNEIYVDNAFYAYRDGSAEHPYGSIRHAINLAEEGDTIYVFGGLYNETLVIDKRIRIIGSIEGGNTILSTGLAHKYAIEITADYVTLESFNVTDLSHKTTVALIFVRSNNVVIQSNNITKSRSYGIYLDSSNDNTIGGNFINDTKGIYFSSSDNNVLSNNNILYSSESALQSYLSNNNIVYNNTMHYNGEYGIYAVSCGYTNISSNTIANSHFDGIDFSQGSNNYVRNNVVNDNEGTGIDLNCMNVAVVGNSLRNNQRGINLVQSGCNIKNNSIYYSRNCGVYAGYGTSSNIIYLNIFFGNRYNAQEKGNNQWYYDGKGNYWDDYNEIDRDEDGIGDTTYSINGGGIDLYPLGYFLKPPDKPIEPSPEDNELYVNLRVTLSVSVSDPDGSEMTVFFYNALTDEQCGVDYNVKSGEMASCNFNLPFETTYAWYTIANDSKLENRSDIWFFITKTRPPENEKPVADPGGPYVSSKDQIVEFDASDSYDPDGDIDFYRWNFGDGTSEILDITPTHVYTRDGEYTVTLTVVDDNGTSDMETTTVTITDSPFNQDPVANAGGSYSGNTGNAVSFNGSSSYDNDGTISLYSWNFGDDSTGIGQTTTHIYVSEGSYTVILTVTDDSGGTNTASTTVEIYPSSDGGIPGFEIIFVIIAIGFILILKRRRK